MFVPFWARTRRSCCECAVERESTCSVSGETIGSALDRPCADARTNRTISVPATSHANRCDRFARFAIRCDIDQPIFASSPKKLFDWGYGNKLDTESAEIVRVMMLIATQTGMLCIIATIESSLFYRYKLNIVAAGASQLIASLQRRCVRCSLDVFDIVRYAQ